MTGEFRSYKITDAAGVLIYRAVVQGANAGEVKKPAAADEGKAVGFTQEAQATQNKSVLVKEAGRTFAVAAGAIAVGDAIGIADATGKVKSVQTDMAAAPGVAKVVNVLGYARTAAAADGDMIEAQIAIFTVKTAVS